MDGRMDGMKGVVLLILEACVWTSYTGIIERGKRPIRKVIIKQKVVHDLRC